MSNSKNKTEKAAPDKPEPPKPARKRAAPKKAQRGAEVEQDENVTHTIAPVHTVVTVTEPVVESVEHITIPQVEEEVKERAVGVWGKVKAWWVKWGWIPVLAILATAILFIYLYVQSGKSNKAEKGTQQVEATITDGKARLNESAYNITANALKTVDSVISIQIKDLNILWEERNRIIENEKEKNAQSKLKSDENKKNILTADTVELNRRARN